MGPKKASIGRKTRQAKRDKANYIPQGQIENGSVHDTQEPGPSHCVPQEQEKEFVPTSQDNSPTRQDAAPAPKRPRRETFKKTEGCAFNYIPAWDYAQYANIGQMDKACQRCGALKFKGERPGLCCTNG